MKKRFLCMLMVLVALFAITASAVTPRAVSIVPDINFSGNKAICELMVVGNKGTDAISASMKLKYGSTVVGSWSASGTGYLSMEKTATVVSGRTYTLVVDVTINNVAEPTITMTATN